VAEICVTKNNSYRRGGFSPQQWVTGRLQRQAGSMMDEEEFPDLGSLEVTASDGAGSFARLSAIREASKKAFMKLDCSSKVARAVLRRAAPLPGNYDQGDLVCYRRRPRIGTLLVRHVR
jgi:hypothetical protein